MKRGHLPRRRVLLDTRQKNWHQNPYVSLLAQSIEPESTAVGFTWGLALFGKYDVVHVHWPEYLLRHRTKVGSVLAKMLFVVWLCRLRVAKIPVLKTMHNRKPHDNYGRFHGFLLRRFEDFYKLQIWLVPPAHERVSNGADISGLVIPHGDYRPWLEGMSINESIIRDSNLRNSARKTVHLLCFGILKRYKNIHEPVAAVAGCGEKDVKLSIKGMAPDADYLAHLRRISNQDDRIEILPGRLADDQLIREILSADVVLIPYPDLYNSGVLLMALSLGRPVALRSSAIALDFQREFGSDWVIIYDGEFSSAVVKRLVVERVAPLGTRHISPKRNWISIGEQHNDAYSLVAKN